MDRFLREAIEKYLTSGAMDHSVLDSSEKRENFKKVCRMMKVEDGVLKYKGRTTDFRPIPTPEEVIPVLLEVHVGDRGNHRTAKQPMVKRLSDKGYAFPASLGGLQALVEE